MLADKPFAEGVLIEFELHLGQLFGLAGTRIDHYQARAAQALDQEGLTLRPFTR